jgi:cyclopropane fatty-acyl-phospholipid synthase-like methyltransferase
MINRLLRRLVGKRSRSQLPKKTDQKRNKDKFALWLEQNPTGTFEQFYADSVAQALAGEKVHSSLGPAIKPGRLETARRIVRAWRSYGLRPSDNVVDYGCGTLRLGRILIEFLDADRYVGLDIDDRILDAGRSQLSADLIASKRPRLEVISAESLRRTAAWGPKWVCSKGVLQHVPPTELDRFFDNLSWLVLAGATGLFVVKIYATSEQLSSKTWAYALDDLRTPAGRSGMELERVTNDHANLLVVRASK